MAIANALLDPAVQERAGNIARLPGLGRPGLYAWFADDEGAVDLSLGLGQPIGHGLIYAGQTGAGTSEATLNSRLRGNHIGGNTYGSTFRLTLASILRSRLGLRPTGGRRMERIDEPALTGWMLDHLSLAAYPLADRATVDALETAVLGILNPPLNLAKLSATPAREALSGLRREFCRTGSTAPNRSRAIAGSSPERERPVASARTASHGYTPEELARHLRLSNAKSLRGFLRREFPRPAGDLWSRWGVLPPDVELAVRNHFGSSR
jgi:hypothetical protein